MFDLKLRRCQAKLFLEPDREIFGRTESQFIGNLRNQPSAVAEQRCGLFEPNHFDEFSRTVPRNTLDFLGQNRFADVQLATQRLDVDASL